jgi:hypothetical protein
MGGGTSKRRGTEEPDGQDEGSKKREERIPRTSPLKQSVKNQPLNVSLNSYFLSKRMTRIYTFPR